MILVDTSIWVHHLRAWDPDLARLLERGRVLGHPWVTGEIALGSLAQREDVLRLLGRLPQAQVVTATELAAFIERHQLSGVDIGYVDVQLLAATRLTPDARLWTRDKRLATAAAGLGLAVDPTIGASGS